MTTLSYLLVSICKCDVLDQTKADVILGCPLLRSPRGYQVLPRTAGPEWRDSMLAQKHRRQHMKRTSFQKKKLPVKCSLMLVMSKTMLPADTNTIFFFVCI